MSDYTRLGPMPDGSGPGAYCRVHDGDRWRWAIHAKGSAYWLCDVRGNCGLSRRSLFLELNARTRPVRMNIVTGRLEECLTDPPPKQ